MTHEDQVLVLFGTANPVPDPDAFTGIVEGPVLLTKLDHGSKQMQGTKTQNTKPTSPPTRNRWLIVAAAAVIAVLGVGTLIYTADNGGDVSGTPAAPDDPASILADYAEARNSGDVDAVMAYDDAVVMGHPLDDDDVATGVDEIRVLQEQIPAIQGSGAGIEYSDIVVSGSTATFSHAFRSIGGACLGGIDHTVTVEGGKIVLYVWGTASSIPCS